MKSKGLIIGIIVAIIAFFVGFAANQEDSKILGSLAEGQAYNATTTYSNSGASTFAVAQQIKTYGGTLGSVVITGAVAGAIKMMDATSTTDISSTTIATFPASTAAGTYVFDSAFGRGLIIQTVSGLVPTTTITWR